MNARILLIDDDDGVREALAFSLEEFGFVVDTAADGESGVARFDAERPDVVLTDLRMPGMSGLDVVRALADRTSSVPVIVFSAYGTVDTAVQAMRAGAVDFVTKPVSREVLKLTLDRVLRQRQLEEENAALRAQLSNDDGDALVVASAAMTAVLAVVDRVADSDATVLITGESGTGKELIARRLHRRSPRHAGPFVALNCSALPRDLLEAELFGFEKGAFTGATQKRRGRFVEASGGTLFLDEIGDLPPDLQVKLLRVLQEGTVDVVGGETVQVDVRILAATHRDLQAMTKTGGFREDLFFRLHVVPIALPPLRERTDDIAPLFLHFLKCEIERHGRDAMVATPAFLDALGMRPWPGNVRELQNLATRLALTAPSATLDVDVLGGSAGNLTGASRAGPLVDEEWLSLPEAGVSLEALERAAVVAALAACRGNRSQAARFLRVPRHVLLYRVEKYGIVDEDWKQTAGQARARLVAERGDGP